jgi:acyl carrier protein
MADDNAIGSRGSAQAGRGIQLNQVTAEVRRIVAEVLEVDPSRIDPDAHLVEDMGMDSMMALEILASVEKQFRIRIPEENLPQMTTTNRIVEIAQQYVRS